MKIFISLISFVLSVAVNKSEKANRLESIVDKLRAKTIAENNQ